MITIALRSKKYHSQQKASRTGEPARGICGWGGGGRGGRGGGGGEPRGAARAAGGGGAARAAAAGGRGAAAQRGTRGRGRHQPTVRRRGRETRARTCHTYASVGWPQCARLPLTISYSPYEWA